VREVCQGFKGDFMFRKEALLALQEAAEAYLVSGLHNMSVFVKFATHRQD
jgi:hypothetical protein